MAKATLGLLLLVVVPGTVVRALILATSALLDWLHRWHR
jgi:hypothetical protein